MGSHHSKISRENRRLEREREDLQRACEEQLQEVLRLQREENLYRRECRGLDTHQLARRSNTEIQSDLYPSLDHGAEPSKNETWHIAAPYVNYDHFRLKPSAPPVSPASTVCQHTETSARPCLLTIHKPASETGAAATMVRASVTTPQKVTVRASVAALQKLTVRASVAAPQKTTVCAPLAPRASSVCLLVAAPKVTTVRASLIVPQADKVRLSVGVPQVTTVRVSVAAPQAAAVRASATAPQAAAVGASVAEPQNITVRALVTAPPQIKVLTSNIKRCQICKKPYEEGIFQCKNGHGACEVCYSLDLSCKLCIGIVKFTDTRNLETRLLRCPNAADGCKLLLERSERTKHDQECVFKKVKCPALGNCIWRGKISQLSIHFDETHPSSRQANINTELVLKNLYKDYNSLQLIKLGTYNFLFYLKVSETERKLYMDVQLVGSKLCASKWYYEIHIFNKNEPRRKHKCVNSCRSSSEANGIFLLGCAVLPLPYAISFAHEGNLTYKIIIKKNFKGF